MDINKLQRVLTSEPRHVLDADIGWVADQVYWGSSSFEQKHLAFSELFQHTKVRRQLADNTILDISKGWEYLTQTQDYSRILSKLTTDYIAHEDQICYESFSIGIDRVHLAKMINGDGIRFLQNSIDLTGHYLRGLSAGLAPKVARESTLLYKQMKKAVNNDLFDEAAKLRDQIYELMGYGFTMNDSVLNE